jgi:hypothetical protein
MMKHFILALGLTIFVISAAAASQDYDPRFIRNFPPGFHGMWWKAERFYKNPSPDAPGLERYRWDRYMSGIMNVTFPFEPIPYDWEYGNCRSFGMPDYNSNDWR